MNSNVINQIHDGLPTWNERYGSNVFTFFWVRSLNPKWANPLLEILSFTTNHYAIGMQLVVICNYLGHVCNYKFGIV
jgi:hypothetical protein